MGLEILAIIPARGASKRLPQKNIRPLAGKPMVAWTWDAARQAASIGRLIVSTDDEKVMEQARGAGVDAPFVRPAELASDTSLMQDVIEHALGWLKEKERYQPDAVLILQPTSPLRTGADIEEAVTLMKQRSADSIVSVCLPAHPPAWMKRVADDGRLLPWEEGKGPVPQRKQELSQAYALNGAIYLTRREVLLKEKTFYPAKTFAYIMPPERSLDVDTAWDFYLAELILKDRSKGHSS